MLKVLKGRLAGLVRGEEGVALVVTLGVFMFLYVVCASVYAVGMAVKEKMHLQAACDAAAYSAAIVQADTLSRIATINRAMSWTYQQMTRRQMDYIVWQWLEETIKHYKADKDFAENYAKKKNVYYSGTLCEDGIWAKTSGWDIDGDIVLNGSKTKTIAELSKLCSGFGDWLNDGTNSAGGRIAHSLYTQTGTAFLGDRKTCKLGLQIDDDLQNIYDMSKAVESLADDLPSHVDDAVRGILMANIPKYMTRGACQYYVKQSDSPRSDYLTPFDNSSYDELVFLSLGNKVYGSAQDVFDTGINDWFEFGDLAPAADLVGKGIHRVYDPKRVAGALRATWQWWAKAWQCVRTDSGEHYHVEKDHAMTCGHSHDPDKCACSGSAKLLEVNAVCRANNDNRYDNRFNGTTTGGEIAWAKPLKLRDAYFGPKGTITVALARRNENPWFSLFGRVTGGIYSAFSPVSNSWSYCFASAKAGYKLYHVPKDYYIWAHLGEQGTEHYREDFEERYSGNVRVFNGPRDYCVDWKEPGSRFADWEYEHDKHGNVVRDDRGRPVLKTTYWVETAWRQSWNLVQDDWDAVMVPVRQGASEGYEEEAYTLREWWRKRIHDYARDKWETIPYRYEPVWRGRNDSYLQTLVNGASWKVLSGGGTPSTSVAAGSDAYTWNIGKPGKSLDWKKIGAEMYH